jgi:hypothetical protein
VGLLSEGSLHDGTVVGVGDERDDNVVALDGSAESLGLETSTEMGVAFSRPAARSWAVARVRQPMVSWWPRSVRYLAAGSGNETRAEEEDLLARLLGGRLSGADTAEDGEDVLPVSIMTLPNSGRTNEAEWISEL